MNKQELFNLQMNTIDEYIEHLIYCEKHNLPTTLAYNTILNKLRLEAEKKELDLKVINYE